MITTLDQLTPATRAVADAWLDASVAAADAEVRDGVRRDLTAALCQVLHADATPEEFADAVARIDAVEGEGEAAPSGTFSSVTEEAFVLLATYPAAILAAVVAHYAARGRSLPGALPSTWDLSGQPKRTMSKPAAASTDIGLALVAAALGVSAAVVPGGANGRAARLAAASGLATVTGVATVLRPLRRTGWWVQPALLGGAASAVVGTLAALALAGRSGWVSRG